MTKRAVPGSLKSQVAQGFFRRRTLKGSRTTIMAVSLAASILMLMSLQGYGNEASTKTQSALQPLSQDSSMPPGNKPAASATATSRPAPQMAPKPAPNQATLPEDAPHITPIKQDVPTQAQPAPQMVSKPAPNQAALPEDAPHIKPIIQGAPGAATVQVPQQ